jgi:hypothetical protein
MTRRQRAGPAGPIAAQADFDEPATPVLGFWCYLRPVSGLETMRSVTEREQVMKKFAGSLAVLFVSLGGCKPIPTEAHMDDSMRRYRAEQRQILEKHAIFDLNCPADELAWVQLSDDTWGVRGCSKQVRYVLICQQRVNKRYRVSESCRWTRESSVEPVDGAGEGDRRKPPVDRL